MLPFGEKKAQLPKKSINKIGHCFEVHYKYSPYAPKAAPNPVICHFNILSVFFAICMLISCIFSSCLLRVLYRVRVLLLLRSSVLPPLIIINNLIHHRVISRFVQRKKAVIKPLQRSNYTDEIARDFSFIFFCFINLYDNCRQTTRIYECSFAI